MERLGTEYGGWYIPIDIKLNDDSIVYSCGVGEDISFDILLSHKTNSYIYLIDPTKKSKIHFEEVKKFFDKGINFSGNIQNDYYTKIFDSHPNLSKILYIDIGIWKEKDILKFYKQSNPEYVSQSIVEGMFSNDYDLINVDSLKSIMIANKHSKIDLLKLDIEGAENIVLEQMLADNIRPTYLCIEFDLYIKQKDQYNTTTNIIKLLQAEGYKILMNDNFNITFQYFGKS